jgi:molybdopterin converting factor small subunit
MAGWRGAARTGQDGGGPVDRVHLRLFGLGRGDASKAHLTQSIESGTTVESLWQGLRAASGPDEKLSTFDRRAMLVLVNGRPIRFLAGWQTVVADEDTVSFMPKAFGG